METLTAIGDEFVKLFVEMAPYLLLGFLLAGILHVFLPQRKMSKLLGKRNLKSSFLAAVAGVPLPLCSCGVIPTGVSLHKNGASKGAAVSFLISTPQTGVDSILVTYSLIGLPFALIRPVVAFITGIVGGQITHLTDDSRKDDLGEEKEETTTRSNENPWIRVLKYAFVDFLQDIAKWLLIGLVIAAVITALVPQDFFDTWLSNPYINMGVILLASIPMYVCATGSVPIAAALMIKGISPGAAFVFLMAGPATNAGTIAVIGKTLGRKALISYMATIILGAIISGVLINEVLPAHWFILQEWVTNHHHHVHEIRWWEWASGALLGAFLLNGLYLQYSPKKKKSEEKERYDMKIIVDGMTCNHCKMNVEKNLSKIENVQQVEVDLATKSVVVLGEDVSENALKSMVNDLGYTFVERQE